MKYHEDPNKRFTSNNSYLTEVADLHNDVLHQTGSRGLDNKQQISEWTLSRQDINTRIGRPTQKKENTNKEVLRTQVLELLQTKYKDYYKIYTDASKTAMGTAIAFVDTQNNSQVARKINENYSIMNAELLAIREALRYTQEKQLDRVVILTDSKSACEAIKNTENANDNFLVFDINQLRNQLIQRNIKIQWIPSHIDVRGNDLADRAAVQATTQRQDMFVGLTLGDTLRLAKKEIWSKWTRLYQEISTEKGKYRFQIQNEPGTTIWCQKMDLSTHEKIMLSRIRSGHSLTKDRKYTWKWADTENCDTCGAKEDIEHILYHCSKYNNIRAKHDILINQKPLNEILNEGSEEEYKSITKFLTEGKIAI
ncbi:uncharacterized protein LOC134286857 [Aedes albopictus]|uniref:ribonuclease H n=1 Tax=Aedes albopictus TaxID=7160 RepID=A0ABM1ZK05_AEDAL